MDEAGKADYSLGLLITIVLVETSQLATIDGWIIEERKGWKCVVLAL